MTTSYGVTARFAIEEDGSVLVGDVKDEMDMAAESVARGMMQKD
jgi:hypothetical protein